MHPAMDMDACPLARSLAQHYRFRRQSSPIRVPKAQLSATDCHPTKRVGYMFVYSNPQIAAQRLSLQASAPSAYQSGANRGFSENLGHVRNEPRMGVLHHVKNLIASLKATLREAFVCIRNPSARSNGDAAPDPVVLRNGRDRAAWTPEQRAAISRYMSWSGDFVDLNRALRSGQALSPKQETWSAAMSSALRSAPTDMRYEGEVYRGFRLEKAELNRVIETRELHEPAFMSATQHIGTAASFAKSEQNGRVPVMLVVKCNGQGIDLAKLQKASAEGNEGEVLFDRGAKFKVLDVVPPGDKAPWHKLTVQLVGESGPKPASDSSLIPEVRWNQIGVLEDSSSGGIYRDESRCKWYVKTPENPDVVRNEILASMLYRELGIAIPFIKAVSMDGAIASASRSIEGLTPLTNANHAAAGDGFVADAWLANWDVAGFGNLLEQGGQPIRVDVGGALNFRAMGERKGDRFGSTVGELDSLRDPGINRHAAAIFKDVSDQQIRSGVQRLAAVPNDRIIRLCSEHGPGNSAERQELAQKLIERKAYLVNSIGSH